MRKRSGRGGELESHSEPRPVATLRGGSSEADRANIRLLQVQELLAASPLERFTLFELSRRLEVPKSSLLPILRVLAERGHVELGPAGEYQLAAKGAEMAREVRLKPPMDGNLLDVAHPQLVALENETRETTFLGVPAASGVEMVYVDRVESGQLIRYGGVIGEHHSLYCNATGLAYLAFLPLERQEQYLSTVNLIPLTPRTVTSIDILRVRLDEVRKSGIATSIEEFATGVSAVAAPIFAREGAPAAVCAIVGPTKRILDRRERLCQAVKARANAISRALG